MVLAEALTLGVLPVVRFLRLFFKLDNGRMPLLLVQLVQLDLVGVLNLLQSHPEKFRHLSQVLVFLLGANGHLTLRVIVALGVLRRLLDDVLVSAISSSLGPGDQFLQGLLLKHADLVDSLVHLLRGHRLPNVALCLVQLLLSSVVNENGNDGVPLPIIGLTRSKCFFVEDCGVLARVLRPNDTWWPELVDHLLLRVVVKISDLLAIASLGQRMRTHE